MNDYARSLLIYFVENFGKIYGHQFVSYNVHNLVYICDDVKLFGPLDGYSCFKFENYLQKLKKKVKTTGRSLAQIVNRLTEESIIVKRYEKIITYPIITFFNDNNDKLKLIKSLKYENYFLSAKIGDNCICTGSRDIVFIEKIFMENDTIFLRRKSFKNQQPYFRKPCDSTLLNITVIEHEQHIEATIDSLQIERKCIVIPVDDEKSVILPLIHEL